MPFNKENVFYPLNVFVASSQYVVDDDRATEFTRQIRGHPLKIHLMAFLDENADSFETIKAALTSVAQSNKRKVLHMYYNSRNPSTEEGRIIKQFGIDNAPQLPVVMFVDMRTDNKRKQYLFPADEINLETLTAFSNSFHAGQLRPFWKSAAPEDDSDKHVKVIVGSQFNQRVMENDKDVLVQFSVPFSKCGACKSLAPNYEKLGKRFATMGIDSVMIATMDIEDNEIDHPKLTANGFILDGYRGGGFPILMFFPGNAKANPIVYNGKGSLGKGIIAVEEYVEFLKEHATTKFDLDAIKAKTKTKADRKTKPKTDTKTKIDTKTKTRTKTKTGTMAKTKTKMNIEGNTAPPPLPPDEDSVAYRDEL
jgi:thiol-disulfide isomerase/thioredoxin